MAHAFGLPSAAIFSGPQMKQGVELVRVLSHFRLGETSVRTTPQPTHRRSTPVPSPARALGRKLALAVGAPKAEGWEEF
jgi:hypothetical protein